MLTVKSKTEAQVPINVRRVSAKLIHLRQETGNIMVGREQAEELALILKHFIETGELPE